MKGLYCHLGDFSVTFDIQASLKYIMEPTVCLSPTCRSRGISRALSRSTKWSNRLYKRFREKCQVVCLNMCN